MENTKNMVRWTDEERALLAHFIRITVSENGLSAKEGCKFASKKLGRSEAACMWQYHNYIKYNPNITVLSPEEEVESLNSVGVDTNKLLRTIENLEAKLQKAEENQKRLLKFIDECMDNFNYATYILMAKTGCITQDDIRYNTALISRMIYHNLEKLDENGGTINS